MHEEKVAASYLFSPHASCCPSNCAIVDFSMVFLLVKNVSVQLSLQLEKGK